MKLLERNAAPGNKETNLILWLYRNKPLQNRSYADTGRWLA